MLKRENLTILALTQFLRGAGASIYGVIWQPFVLSLGASMPTLGLLNSLGGAGGLITTLVQPLGGWLADRWGRKPFIIGAGFAMMGAYALFAFAGALNVWTLVLAGVIFSGIAALARPAVSSLTAESARGERHASAFSLITVAAMVPGIIAPLLGGWVAERFGYVGVFPILIALELLAVLLLWRYLRETRTSIGTPIHWRAATGTLARWIHSHRSLLGFFCALAADSFFWGIGWGLLNGMLTDTYHFTVEQLGVMASIMSLTWAIIQMPIGRFIDRRGTLTMMIFSESLGIPLMLIWMTQSRFEIFAASQVLFALTAATWVPITSTYLTRRVAEAERSAVFGLLNTFRGLVGFPAPAIGGLLYDWGGIRAPLLANLFGIFVVIAILVLFVREPRAVGSKE